MQLCRLVVGEKHQWVLSVAVACSVRRGLLSVTPPLPVSSQERHCSIQCISGDALLSLKNNKVQQSGFKNLLAAVGFLLVCLFFK